MTPSVQKKTSAFEFWNMAKPVISTCFNLAPATSAVYQLKGKICLIATRSDAQVNVLRQNALAGG